MISLKDVRNRITSVDSTRQITNAMKMVSAAKLRKAQSKIISMRPYASKLKEILEHISSGLDATENIYSKQRDVKHVLLIAITSNRGLCGAFNSNVIKLTDKIAYKKYKGNHVTVLTIGKKATDYYKRTELGLIGPDMPKKLFTLFDNLTFDNAASVAEKIMGNFEKGDFEIVELVYNRFKNASVQTLTSEQFLPVTLSDDKNGENDKVERSGTLPDARDEAKAVETTTSSYLPNYIFEMKREIIIKELIPKSLKVQFYKALLESFTAEHGARMTAMHIATDNANEILKDLKLSYNKARQASITKELLDIVGGAEAINN